MPMPVETYGGIIHAPNACVSAGVPGKMVAGVDGFQTSVRLTSVRQPWKPTGLIAANGHTMGTPLSFDATDGPSRSGSQAQNHCQTGAVLPSTGCHCAHKKINLQNIEHESCTTITVPILRPFRRVFACKTVQNGVKRATKKTKPFELDLCLLKWQVSRGSNPRPAVLETAALPTELLTCVEKPFKIFLLPAMSTTRPQERPPVSLPR